MKLCGLDFETANFCNGSICAIGAALIENGVTTERLKYLIKPHKSMDYINHICQDVHGIAYEDLRESPEFPQIWQRVRQLLISADSVVIHNASFDLRHLRNVLEIYNLPSVSFHYLCSLKLCRHHLPELPGYGLADMAEHFVITFQHHDAWKMRKPGATFSPGWIRPDYSAKHIIINKDQKNCKILMKFV